LWPSLVPADSRPSDRTSLVAQFGITVMVCCPTISDEPEVSAALLLELNLSAVDGRL
jgi:hypothetical protein